MPPSSTTLPRRPIPNDTQYLEPPAHSLRDALCRDYRKACREFEHTPEDLAERYDITASAVYKWFERKDYIFSPDKIEAIVAVTGGACTLAYLRHVAAWADCRDSQDDNMSGLLAEIIIQTGEMSRWLAENSRSGDSLSREQVSYLRRQAQDLQSQVCRLDAALERLQELAQ